MKNIFKSIGLAVVALSMFTISCSDDIDPVIENLNLDRPLAPVNLRAFIRNQTAIELSWNVNQNISEYIVEFSQDSLDFNSIIRTVSILPDSLPLTENFEGETQYSARVKAIRENGEESSWAEIAVMTAIENILEPFEGGDIAATSVTFRWPAGSEVTNFTINPGNIVRPITEAEKVAGEATIEGLIGSTAYTITLFDGAKRRGVVEFETLVDIGNATAVYPEDDLLAIIAAATDGDVLALFPGTYDSLGTIALDKSLTIRGVYPFNRPIMEGATFDLVNGVQQFELLDLELNGYEGTTSIVINLAEESVDFGDVSISGCFIHDYGTQLIYGNVASTLESFSVENSVISDFVLGGGDFIDFRPAFVANIALTNSTFNNTPSERRFIRLDEASAFSGTGLKTTVNIDHCTIYNSVGNDRLLYVRFLDNSISVTNTIIAETEAFYTRDSNTSPIDLNNNNYFNAEGFHTAGYRSESAFQYDQGSFFTLDPGFGNAEEGDFTISNQILLDNQIGDPRWR